MKNKNVLIILIIVLSLLVVALTIGFIFLLNNNFKINLSNNLELIDCLEENVDLINNIDFKLISTDVEIKISENENIKIEYYSNTEKNAKIEEIENSIKINEDSIKSFNFGFNNDRRKIILYIPNLFLGNYNIATMSGDVFSEIDMNKNKVNIVTISGDIKLKDIDDCSITTTSGDIIVDKASNNLNINSTSGDIKIDKILKKINVHTVSGDININELDIKENSRIETTSGDVVINNNICNCYVDVNIISGDKLINHFDRKSDIELKIKTISGDIKVN